MQKTEEIIMNYIKENFIAGRSSKIELTPEISLLESGIMDSTGILELVLFLEEQFAIKIDDEEIVPENLDSVANLLVFLEKKKVAITK
ncbi:MAG TPA: acyl carrier protein [Spirochaetota bacterium]|nr:acyl carrier protein [Spirochaetota bacterium]HPC43422.1 acyl carrier protein [Spirochaetota bacterium]HPL19112.1 acyl carrier protein [Spirochaetota bacterium]HQF06710.1 acyl carrier protein [Spirochaetota bacterium]HQH95887.1 acyl carrier protein [Spirochaetota bacterium]